MSRRVQPVHLFCAAVSFAGAVLLVLSVARAPDLPLEDPWLAALALGVVLGELRPLQLPLRGGDEEVNLSTSFSFALLLGAGLVPALLAQVVASALQDGFSRKPLWRLTFNLGQYVLSLSAAHAVLVGFGFHPADAAAIDTAGRLFAVLGAGSAFFVVNFLTVGIAVSLHQRAGIWRYLRNDIGFSSGMAAVLIALGPIVLATEDRSPLLLALLVFPFNAVHRGGKEAVRSRHAATHDALTGLPNRTRFHALVEQAIEQEEERGGGFAVLLIDFDRFKEINDTLGHQYGDRVLTAAGPRLASCLPDGDVLARLGGDEFAVLVRSRADADVDAVVERLLARMRSPFDIDGFQCDLDASIGIAHHPQDGEDVHSLLRSADVAMYRAKERHLGSLRYSPDQDPNSRERLALVGDLRRATGADDQLAVWYQPKLDVAERRVVGVEALVRWHHPQLGMLAPDTFIPLAEQTGLIKPLTLKVLGDVLRDAATWRARGLELGVAVNLSTRGLLDAGLADKVAALLAEHGAEPGWLTLEITESAIMADPEAALRVVADLRAMGITLSIDDFGTGYSSLAYLRDLHAAEIKIDRTFVQHMATVPGDAAIVKSTIDLARNLGLRVVAEGVEDAETLEALGRLGADHAQGYFMSPPRPREDFERWLDGPVPRALARGAASLAGVA